MIDITKFGGHSMDVQGYVPSTHIDELTVLLYDVKDLFCFKLGENLYSGNSMFWGKMYLVENRDENVSFEEWLNIKGLKLEQQDVSETKRTSKEWLDIYHGYEILDADGWDRQNYDYSFYKEKITRKEFYNRLMKSTIQIKIV